MKMRDKKLISMILLLAAVLTVSLILPGTAYASLPSPRMIGGSPDPVVDEADLLTDSEEENLRQEILSFRDRYDFDIVILTVNSTGGSTATEFADDFYDKKGYGGGENKSGILLLVDMGDRAWATSTAGRGIEFFDDNTLYDIEDEAISYLSSGEYYGAFSSFVSRSENRVTSRIAAETFDISDVLRSILIGFLLALIPLIIQLLSMKSVKAQSGAGEYHSSKGLTLSACNDQFVRHAVTKTPIPKETRSGGGGSSTHMSSSGVSHGGHSGHF